MDTSLPMYVDPARLASRRETLTGTLAAHGMTRLSSFYRCVSPVAVELSFAPGQWGRIKVDGNLTASLEAQCQRCLQPIVVLIEQQLNAELLDLDSSGVAEHVQDGEFDDAIEYRTKLNVFEFVEDELVLACPIVPSHSAGQCDGENAEPLLATDASTETHDDAPESTATRKPFAGLADMMAQTPKPNGKSD